MYLSYRIKPDIAFVVSQISRHNADPRKKYLWVTKKVVKYLKETTNMDLIFGWKLINQLSKDPPPYGLLGYVDNNFIIDSEDWNSVMGYYFFINRAVIF